MTPHTLALLRPRLVGALVLLTLGAAGPAYSRTEDGRLGLIRSPHDLSPAVTEPGVTFDALVETRAQLTLVGTNARIPLETDWEDRALGLFRAVCLVPEDCPPGVYALEASADGGGDLQLRAVRVLPAVPDAYEVVHIAAPRIADGEVGAAGRERLRAALNAANGRTQRPASDTQTGVGNSIAGAAESDATPRPDGDEAEEPELTPSLIVITGPLTQSGTVAEFGAFREIAGASELPVYATPGPEDMREGLYEAYFGGAPSVLRFGDDGYLLLDTTDNLPVEDFAAQAGALQQARREIAGARWAIGLTYTFSLRMGMRAQMALLIDTPLDLLVVTTTDVRDETGAPAMPWGNAAVVETPYLDRGLLRILEIYPYGIVPRDPETP